MSVERNFIIGDIQGCYEGLQRLLDKVSFNPEQDTLHGVGDLVARGEDSLSTLRFLRSLGPRFHSVLGNHDLHLLAVANGIKKPKKDDKLAPLLAAPDLPELVDWLRQFPLATQVGKQHTLVHAGLYPAWSTEKLLMLSEEVSQHLQSACYADLLEIMYGNTPRVWEDTLSGTKRLRFIINACTRMRYLNKTMHLEFETKTHPSQSPASLAPWFTFPNPFIRADETLVFGHWAALAGDTNHPQFVGLDTGYVWGNSLTMLHIETNQLISVDA